MKTALEKFSLEHMSHHFRWSIRDTNFNPILRALKIVKTERGGSTLNLSSNDFNFRQMAIYTYSWYPRTCFDIIFNFKFIIKLYIWLSSPSSVSSLWCSSTLFNVDDILFDINECMDLVNNLSYT